MVTASPGDNGSMIVLGLETSCDDTGVALYESEQGLLAHRLASQVEVHRPYGGVVPELAARDHIRKLLPLVQAVMTEADVEGKQVDGIAFTKGPVWRERCWWELHLADPLHGRGRYRR